MPFSAAAPTSPAEVNEAIAALSARLGALRDEGLALEGELDTAFSSESLSRCAAMVAAQTRIAAVARRARARRIAARRRAVQQVDEALQRSVQRLRRTHGASAAESGDAGGGRPAGGIRH